MASFNLSGGDAGFSNRSNSVFDNLNSISNNLSMNKTDIIPVKRKSTNEGSGDGGCSKVARCNQDKEFKKPQIPCKTTSQQNRQGWTKYDLSDVDVSDDRGNSKAALSFLHTLSKREENSDNMDTTSKVVFEKPTGCVKMPELRKPKPARSSSDALPAEEVELEHLIESTEASDYQAEIEAKWLAQNKPVLTEQTTTVDEQKPSFKSVNKKKRRQNVRSRTNNDD